MAGVDQAIARSNQNLLRRLSPDFVDSKLSEALFCCVDQFVLFGAEIAQRRVKPTTIAEYLDVVEDVRSCFVACTIHTMVHPLALQCTEEALLSG